MSPIFYVNSYVTFSTLFLTDFSTVSHEAQVSGGDAGSTETRAEGDRREHAGVQPDVQPATQTQHPAGIRLNQGRSTYTVQEGPSRSIHTERFRYGHSNINGRFL